MFQAQSRNSLSHCTFLCNCSKLENVVVVITAQQLFLDKILVFDKL